MEIKIDSESSFLSLLKKEAPDLWPLKNADKEAFFAPHGTTVLAIKYNGGVLAAGDKRCLSGYDKHSELEKVYKIDSSTLICIAGTAGPALELVKSIQTQAEYYKRKTGFPLCLEGKLNAVSEILREYFKSIMVTSLELQPVIVSPLLVYFDSKELRGRIFYFDITGAGYEKTNKNFFANGSGQKDAGSYLRILYRDNLNQEEAIDLARKAIIFAAEENVATGKISSVKIITEAGVSDIED